MELERRNTEQPDGQAVEGSLDAYIVPGVRRQDDWERAFEDEAVVARFNELVDWTAAAASEEYPWAYDRRDIAGRWQLMISALASEAGANGHPLFEQGRWGDEKFAQQVLESVEHRHNPDAGFAEKGIALAHSLAIAHGESEIPGINIKYCSLINSWDMEKPELVEYFTSIYDLRDFGPAEHTVIGELDYNGYRALSEEQRQELRDRLQVAYDTPKHGKRYGWLMDSPQMNRYEAEAERLSEFYRLDKYGTVKDDEIDVIRDDRKAAEIARAKAERPDFGKTPDGWAELPERLREITAGIYGYFDDMRDRFEIPRIDTHTLGHMELKDEELQALIDKGILVNEQSGPSPGGFLYSWELSTPYYEAWVANQYTDEEIADVVTEAIEAAEEK
jgi:hypothetical protein